MHMIILTPGVFLKKINPIPLDNDDFDIITDAPVDAGEFSLKLPNGDYKLGLWIGPESGYSMISEADADLSAAGDESTSTVSITIGTNDKTISGKILDLRHFGGFLVTQRMLAMYKKKKKDK